MTQGGIASYSTVILTASHLDGHLIAALLLHVRDKISAVAAPGARGQLRVQLLTREERKLLEQALVGLARGLRGVRVAAVRSRDNTSSPKAAQRDKNGLETAITLSSERPDW